VNVFHFDLFNLPVIAILFIPRKIPPPPIEPNALVEKRTSKPQSNADNFIASFL
jgi:hypothetical protein